MVYSWWLSYPLAIGADDSVFYHVSIFYWVSLPLLLGSMFLMAVMTKNNLLKWLLAIGIVLTLYSLYYFYSTIPTSDTQYFRGLSEYFIQTKNLDVSQSNHSYYQWPSYFLLIYTVISITGLSLTNFEFLLFTLIGILWATCLYVYVSKKYKDGAFIAVVAFFIAMLSFLNYQAVPFSLAIGIFFVLLMMETLPKSRPIIITELILYGSLLITHVFVPLLFVIYLLIRSILDKSARGLYGRLFLFSLVSYFAVQLSLARFSFAQILTSILRAPTEYISMVSATLAPVTVPFDVTAQLFSRTVQVAFVLICVVGFVFLLIKRKLSVLDKAILLMGASYSILGVFINSLGWRAVSIAFIPISLGAAFLFEKSRFKLYFKGVFLILLVLFVFIPVHQAFGNTAAYQTEADYQTENFFINHYNSENPQSILMGFRAETYVSAKLPVSTDISTNVETLNSSDIIILTSELLGKNSLGENITSASLLQEEQLNVIYNNGYSIIAVRP